MVGLVACDGQDFYQLVCSYGYHESGAAADCWMMRRILHCQDINFYFGHHRKMRDVALIKFSKQVSKEHISKLCNSSIQRPLKMIVTVVTQLVVEQMRPLVHDTVP